MELASSGHVKRVRPKLEPAPPSGGETPYQPFAGNDLYDFADDNSLEDMKEPLKYEEPAMTDERRQRMQDVNNEEAFYDAKADIGATKVGGLLKLREQFEDMKVKFKAAADKVWVGGDDDPNKDNNFIAGTAFNWDNAVQKFKINAGKLRHEAERVYAEMIKAHTLTAKKQMKQFREEMKKLVKIYAKHEAMKNMVQEEAKKENEPGVPDPKQFGATMHLKGHPDHQ